MIAMILGICSALWWMTRFLRTIVRSVMCTTIVVCQLVRKFFQALVHAVDEFFRHWALPDFREPGGRRDADLPTYPYSYDNRAQFDDSHPDHDAFGLYPLALFRGGCLYRGFLAL